MLLSKLSENRIITLIVSFAMFMEALDTTIINTAIPTMAISLQVNPIDLKIALISYLLSLAIFIPISGWIADKFGVKRVFMFALCFFTLASVWCGFSRNLTELVLARVLQGLGGSLMIPVGRLILLRTFKRHEYIETMNRVVVVAAMGLMLGPVLGGLITTYLSWKWIFWVNIPVGLITILFARIYLENTPPRPVPKLDKLGFILFGTGLASFTFSLSAFSESSLPVSYTIIALFGSLLMLLLYFWHSRHEKYPILNVQLFKLRTFQISVSGNLLARLGFGGMPFLLPLLLQIGLGYSAQASGLLIAPIAAGIVLIKPFTLLLLRLFGYKELLIINTILVALALVGFSLIKENTPVIMIAMSTFLFGFLISLQYSGMNSLAYAEINHENLSAATSIMSTIQQLTQSFGVATAALLVTVITQYADSSALTSTVFHHTFIILAVITFLSSFIFLRLKPEDGLSMIKKEIENKATSSVVP